MDSNTTQTECIPFFKNALLLDSSPFKQSRRDSFGKFIHFFSITWDNLKQNITVCTKFASHPPIKKSSKWKPQSSTILDSVALLKPFLFLFFLKKKQQTKHLIIRVLFFFFFGREKRNPKLSAAKDKDIMRIPTDLYCIANIQGAGTRAISMLWTIPFSAK